MPNLDPDDATEAQISQTENNGAGMSSLPLEAQTPDFLPLLDLSYSSCFSIRPETISALRASFG